MVEFHDQVAGEMPARVHVAPGVDLTIQDVVAVARHQARVELGGDWRQRCDRSADYVRMLVEESLDRDERALAERVRARFRGQPAPRSIAALLEADPSDAGTTRRLAQRALVYGVTTGFGNNKNRPLRSREQCAEMQLNLLRSHACGVGEALPAEVVRAAMLLRLRSFVEGYSGVRPDVVELLRDCLNRGVHPWVPAQGSVGSSGDLCPLAHLAQVLVGEGYAWLEGGIAARAIGGDPLRTAGPRGHPGLRVEDNEHSTESPGHAMRPGADRPASSIDDGCQVAAGPGEHSERMRRPPMPAAQALAEAGLKPLDGLEPKEALALTNGTSITTALAALATYDAAVLLGTANVAAAMSLQALRGCSRAYDPRIHASRRHAGQMRAAADILRFAAGGSLLDTSDDTQDAYSLRCAPQVHGAAGSAIEHAWSIIEHECNAVTDNPLFFLSAEPSHDRKGVLPEPSDDRKTETFQKEGSQPSAAREAESVPDDHSTETRHEVASHPALPGGCGSAQEALPDGRSSAAPAAPPDSYGQCIWDAYSGGNFHGEPVGMAADYLKIAVAELASISERRTQYLLDRHHNRGLPANLCPAGLGQDEEGAADGFPADGGAVNSGLMIAQYVAAALVSENKVLAHPASVDSIPTSSNAEDHVAMSPIAARHARQVVENARNVLAIELVCAAQGLEWLQGRVQGSGFRVQGIGDQGSGIGEQGSGIGEQGLGIGEQGSGIGKSVTMQTKPAEGTAPVRGVALSPAAAAVLAELRCPSASGAAVPYIRDRDVTLWPLVAAAASRIAAGVVLRVALDSSHP